MVDGVYQDIAAALKPGIKESQVMAMATKRLYELGSDCVEAINAISMVFAVATSCPARDGTSAARIEEEVVLTPHGATIIALYPAEELPIANTY